MVRKSAQGPRNYDDIIEQKEMLILSVLQIMGETVALVSVSFHSNTGQDAYL